ncbi:hypothetical protein DFP72DRAFT_973352 [Ephemerocybe angulata]|uniref:Uncharacterized protein n=1 Tax=Ephemerocybe angulata TaxID=980116 RepID=A0A8H6LYB1_9AGAR|nr:hypothetical protein DFP72DRAFT_973352 [Tulosesus angulatus]
MSTLEEAPAGGGPTGYRLTNVPPELYAGYVFETVGATFSLILYGIAISLFLSCLRSLIPSLKRSGISVSSRPKLLHLIYVCLIFTVGTMYMFSIAWILVYLRLEYPLYPGGPLGWEFDHYNHPVMNLGNAAFTMTGWFADGFMMYRCYVVYSQKSRIWTVLILPGLLYVASITTGILLLTQTSLPKESLFSQINFALTNFSIVASLHILLTLLILGRLLIHRLQIQKIMGGDSGSLSMYTSVSSILIESSALYSTFALLFIVPFALGHPLAQFSLAMLAIVQVISPLLVAYRLTQKRAWTSSTTHNMSVSTGGMHFGTNDATLGGQSSEVIILKEKAFGSRSNLGSQA